MTELLALAAPLAAAGPPEEPRSAAPVVPQQTEPQSAQGNINQAYATDPANRNTRTDGTLLSKAGGVVGHKDGSIPASEHGTVRDNAVPMTNNGTDSSGRTDGSLPSRMSGLVGSKKGTKPADQKDDD